MNTYIIVLWLASLLLGYSLVITEATLIIGRSISSTEPYRFQDAITPPWSTNLSLVVFSVSIGVVGYGWYQYDWLTGMGITVGFVFLLSFNKVVLLPKRDSGYLRSLILRSLINRYADYMNSGDIIRATATAELLKRLNHPVPEEFRK